MSGAVILSLLGCGPAAARRGLADGVDGLDLRRVQLGSGGASLLVTAADGEWVMHWPRRGEPTAWSWPHDPHLPALAAHPVDRALLDDPSWQPEGPAGEVTEVRRVGYKPGRRATFRLDVGPGRYLLKLVSADDLAAAVSTSRFAGDLPPEQVRAPRLQAHSAQLGAVLLPYLPGAPVNQLPAAARSAPLAAVPGVLAALHARDHTGYDLPRWDATHPLRKLLALAAAVRRTDPGWAEAARPVVAGLGARLASWTGPTGPVHGDLSLRNLVWDDTAPAPARLGVIDWDRAAVGPREVDLSPLVGLLGDDAGDLVTTYEQASGQPVDRDLLDSLVRANRLSRALRRAASGREPRVSASMSAGLGLAPAAH